MHLRQRRAAEPVLTVAEIDEKQNRLTLVEA